MTRNVLWRHPEGGCTPGTYHPDQCVWVTTRGKAIAYTTDLNLFGYEEETDNETITEGFRARLKTLPVLKM